MKNFFSILSLSRELRSQMFALFLVFPFLVFAQTPQIFTLENYLQQVRTNHPVIKQADLLERQAAAVAQTARGNFDPKIYADASQKSFDDKNYFTLAQGGLKIPTWLGTELKAGYNWTNGDFLDPENSLPEIGQAVLGAKITLLQGLLIDDRRAALKQAKIFKAQNENTRRQMVNTIIFDAAKTYWEWSYAFEIFKIKENALGFARTRLGAVVTSFEQGDKPAIDTLESTIQVQNRELELNEAQIDFQNSALKLSNFLWSENAVPLEIAGNARPEFLPREIDIEVPSEVVSVQNNLAQTHPDLLDYQLKRSQLEIERRLKVEKLKPKLNLEYNFLANGFDFQNGDKLPGNETNFNTLFSENYKWGVEFSMPIFLRQARGNLKLTDLKIEMTDLKLSQKMLEIKNKIEIYLQQLQNQRKQLILSEDMTENYRLLLAAENEKFRIGESSLFLVNSREQKLIEAETKLAKLRTDFVKLEVGLRQVAGVLK